MRQVLYFLSIFFPSAIAAQVNIKLIVANKNHEPLPLTNIVSVSRNIGTITNFNGEFFLQNVDINDSIKISNIAYQSIVIAISEIKVRDTIVLTENIKVLKEVVITNSGYYKREEVLGFYNYQSDGSFQLGPGNQLAIYIANKNETAGWLKGILFKVKSFGKCKNSIRIRLLEVDTLKFKPSADILDENVIIPTSDLKRSNYIDLAAYKITFPKEGIFVVFEWLYPDNDCDKNSFTSLASNLLEARNIVWFNFRDKAWGNLSRPRLHNGNYNTPNIGLRVAY